MPNVHDSRLSFKPPFRVRFVEDYSLPPAEQLAFDEAFLDLRESSDGDGLLRFWEPDRVFVVLGRTSAAAHEIRLDVCRSRNIPILRRVSGGGTVVQSPGCLNFSLVLAMTAREEFATAGGTNASIMRHHADVLGSLTGEHVEVSGFSDLTIAGRKFSGNAQRRKLRYFLFHGCILLNADLNLMEELLPLPPKQPAYRESRSHAMFVCNLTISSAEAKQALRNAWNVRTVEHSIPRAEIDLLVRERYENPAWTAL